ncbi:MAG: YkgJ family cysteine cluster protein [Desulfobacter sp.]
MNEKKDIQSQEDRSRQLLAVHVEKARVLLDRFLDNHGVKLPVLGKAMESFAGNVFELPGEAACKPGCAYCCHLRLGVSIPELLVIFYELEAQSTPEGLAYFKNKIADVLSRGNTLSEAFWHDTQTPCPFLDDQGRCLIYPIRPFSCRAYHSTDAEVCRKGYEEMCEVQVPCFPLYRATTDMYTSVFIKVLSDRGFASYQVGFVKGLGMLFEERSLSDQWLGKRDVFAAAAL